MTFPLKTLPSKTAHLSEDAFDALLIGSASPAEQTHLAACTACAGRLAEFRGSLATFNQASAAWSQARSNSISRELPTGRTSQAATAAWSFASVTLVAIALAFTSQLHRSPDFAASAQHGSEQTSSPQKEIADDNAMLVAIDSEISEPVHSPVLTSEIRPSAASENRIATHEAHD